MTLTDIASVLDSRQAVTLLTYLKRIIHALFSCICLPCVFVWEFLFGFGSFLCFVAFGLFHSHRHFCFGLLHFILVGWWVLGTDAVLHALPFYSRSAAQTEPLSDLVCQAPVLPSA